MTARLSLTALAALLATACVVPPVQTLEPEEPLRGWIVPREMGGFDASAIRFHLNRPAYVAIFRQVSGGSFDLMYPATRGDDRLHHAGFGSGFGPRRSHQSASLVGGGLAFGRTHYILIASDRPLDLGAMVVSRFAVDRAIGLQMSRSGNPYAVGDALVRSLVGPRATPGTYSVDVYVDWPDPGIRRTPIMLLAMEEERVVECPDGSVEAARNTDPVCLPEDEEAEASGEGTRTVELSERARAMIEGVRRSEERQARIRGVEIRPRPGERIARPDRVEARPPATRDRPVRPPAARSGDRDRAVTPRTPTRERPVRSNPRPRPADDSGSRGSDRRSDD